MKWSRYAALPVFLASATLAAPVEDPPNEVDQRFRPRVWFRPNRWRADEGEVEIQARDVPEGIPEVDQRYRVNTWFRPGGWRQEGEDGNDGTQPPEEGQPQPPNEGTQPPKEENPPKDGKQPPN